MATKKRLSVVSEDGTVHDTGIQEKKSNSLVVKLDHMRTFSPLTNKQAEFFEAYKRGGYCMALLGSPGTGKTFAAMYRALEEVLDKSTPFSTLVIVRSAVQTREQGFLPGTLEEKQEIYEQPYKEICQQLFGRPDAYQRLKEQGHIRFITTTAIRGISLDDSIVLLDEVQNTTWAEATTVLTRVGHRSKFIMCGDKFQNDLLKHKNDQSGLEKFVEVLGTLDEFEAFYFSSNDIVRSSLVKSFIVACEKMGYMPSQ